MAESEAEARGLLGCDGCSEKCMGLLPDVDGDLWDELYSDRGLEGWS